jgi:hypothetical protein
MFSHQLKITKSRLYFALTFIFVLLLIGTLLFSSIEEWSFVDSFYFSTATLTTVGYGDLVPTHNLSKILTSIYTLLGVGTFLYSIGIVAEFYFYKRFTILNKKIEKRKK